MSIGFDTWNCWVSKSAAPSSEAIVRARLTFVDAGATFHVGNSSAYETQEDEAASHFIGVGRKRLSSSPPSRTKGGGLAPAPLSLPALLRFAFYWLRGA
jgi:hypothetical protein